ncbi:type I polyketide synthase [Rhodococcus sp. MTM3W5.2]|uniref:type I polyketide synthase n=1 Tax=Rhodococcus sp. MTM3W5.2 TaxID=1805827 RepID=UPI00097BF1D3|nr:type I polyketide synthase [Rhodococcus sp. MTM3W5.2]
MAKEQQLRENLRWVTASLHRAQQQLAEAESRTAEPIAVVGMACRFPGGIASPEQLWRVAVDGLDNVTDLPTDRGWDLDAVYDEEPGRPGKLYTRAGGFLTDIDRFDAALFGISPREADAMDPQHRLLLETSWEAFEAAGLDIAGLRGSQSGVFVGLVGSDYRNLALSAADDVEGHLLTGNAASVASGRIAYTFGLEGPAVTIDTACSSSLVAMHLAAQSLRRGECDLALAGGATVITTPTVLIEMSRQQVFPRDGRCRSYAAAADGMGWGEGVGVLVLERLTDARRNGHQVLAVIRGSAVNQDGASNGLSAPNGVAQQRVIGAALADAGLTAADIDVVEGHGTGTTLGDPIEIDALMATYGRGRDSGRPLLLGSIKSNIGHAQAAAGVAGVIKMVEAIRHGLVPKTLHVDQPTPHVDWSSGAIRLLTEASPWPEADRPRRAAVSGFGISGTNAHVILEQDQPEPVLTSEPGSTSPLDSALLPWVLSAHDTDALRAQARRLATFAEAHSDVRVADIGFSLLATRTALDRRAVVLATDQGEFRASLDAFVEGRADARVLQGIARAAGGVVFVFPGAGTQWQGMAAGLLKSSPVFRQRFAECERALGEFVDYSPTEVLLGDPAAPPLSRIDVLQPVLFAVMVSLARLWDAFGVRPAAVVGHSQGEVAAACVAGALSLRDGARVVCLRSKAWTRLSGKGAMASVALSYEAALARIERFDGRLSVAAVNSPSVVAITGEEAALEALVTDLDAEGIHTRRLHGITGAGHSPQVDTLREQLLRDLAPVSPQACGTAFYSTVTGGLIDPIELNADYWFRNARRPVLFGVTVRALAEAGYTTYLELGPHPALGPSVLETVESTGVQPVLLSTLRREEGGPERFLTALAEAFVAGVDVDWNAHLGALSPVRVPLPTYSFQGGRHWIEQQSGAGHSLGGSAHDQIEDSFWAAVEGGDAEALARTLGRPDDEADSWGELLSALQSWRRDNRAGSTVDQWRYRIRWQPISGARAAMPRDTWIVLAPDDSAAHELVHRVVDGLRARGAEVVTATTSTLRPALAVADIAGVLSLLGLDERPSPDHPTLTNGVVATLDLVRALDGAFDTRLWCVTNGAVTTGLSDQLRSPEQAQLWGLGIVAALEFPDRWGGMIDLPAQLDDRALDRLAGLLAAPVGEDQLAVRSSGLFARRMVRARRTSSVGSAGRWRPRGTVLVTGGTGALGAHVARWLAATGAEHLVLVSRRGQGADGADALRSELENLGTAVTFAACDVSDRLALARLLGDLPQIDAVVHTAGVPQYQPLSTMSATEFAAVHAAKAAGARHLDELLADRPLDAFVLFSSGAAVWGSAGQAAYAAANAYADALARARRQRGAVATVISWGGWAGGGMVDDEVATKARRLGLRLMAPELALRALQEALEDGETALTVTDMEWDRFAPTFTTGRASALISEIPDVVAGLRDQRAAVDVDRPAVVLALDGLTDGEQREVVLDIVRVAVAAVLGHSSPEAIGPDTVFKDLGFDSLTAVELRNRLAAELGLRLPTTLVFDHPTPNSAVRYLRNELFGNVSPLTPLPAAEYVDEPLAIVGMACRFPGGVESPEDLWQLMIDGVDTVTPFPTDRGWDLERLYDPEGTQPGTSYVREGAFLDDAAGFDAEFFGISPREAMAMDPQQRLLLETSWEVLERAGIDPLSLRGSDTGVFVGGASHDYAAQLMSSSVASDGYALTGGVSSVLSGRISYHLGLEGPAVTVDTACSSSLVAMHLAGQALRRGECSLALAGAATVMSTAVGFVEFSRQGGLARDGRCRPFDRAATGTGWGEGVGFLVMERLTDARRNGRRVLAVLRGSAVNSDGASNGLTAPNGPSQQRVIQQALAASRLMPADIDMVEAHGTATTLGDPIEAQALLSAYGQERERPLLLGSVKSNIGHTQAAAGVAGVIKTVLALQHGMVPRTLHLTEPTPHVAWSSGAVEPVAANMPWPETGQLRRAGVSAFGVSGTNAHVIIEQAPVDPEAPRTQSGTPLLPWTVSARSAVALRAQATRLLTVDAEPADMAWSLAAGRAHLDHRAVILGRTAEDLQRGLNILATGGSAPEVVTGVSVRAKLVMLFAGQGTQRVGMGRELYDAYPRFADALDEVCAQFDPVLDRELRTVMFTDEQALEQTGYVQPALFALEVALFHLLAHWGVKPDVVLGHSAGEIAAAHVAGVLSLPDAVALVTARGQLMQQLPAGGAMLSVSAGADEVRAICSERLQLAAVNGPTSVVLSGGLDAVAAAQTELAARGIRAKRLRVSHAFHSCLMEPMLDEFAAVCAGLEFSPPQIPFVSTVTGAIASAADIGSPDYWVRNVRDTVRFADGLRAAGALGELTLLELGPDGALSALVHDSGVAPALPALRAGHSEEDTVSTALAGLHSRGVAVDWPIYFAARGGCRVDLPTYAFQHQRFWLEARSAPGSASDFGLDLAPHPLLDAGLALPGTRGWLFIGTLSPAREPWLTQHGIDGVTLLPGTALLDIVVAAGEQLGCPLVDELTLEAPVALSGGIRIQLLAGSPDGDGRRSFTVHFRADDTGDKAWIKAASGTFVAEQPSEPVQVDWPPVDADVVSVTGYDERAELAGLTYGSAFRGLRKVWLRGDEVFAEIELPAEVDATRYGLHPALLDAALRAPSMTQEDRVHERLLPFSWQGVRLHRAGARHVRVRIAPLGSGELSIIAVDPEGRPVLSVDALSTRSLPSEQLDRIRKSEADALFKLAWVPAAADAEQANMSTEWMNFDTDGTAGDLIGSAHAVVDDAVDRIRTWLSDDRNDGSRLVVTTRRAVATRADEGVLDLAHAPIWGLVRSIQAEYPGRIVLIDLDGESDPPLPAELGGEPQLAVRAGAMLTPRLAPLKSDSVAAEWDSAGTALVTGATGGLGALVVRHLAVRHGVRGFVLASRRGPEADGAAELLAELAALGAEAQLVACDVADRTAVANLIDSVPSHRPLRAVVHVAGVVADGVLDTLTPSKIDAVLRPKLDAAVHLDELTRNLDLSAFVLFSSTAGAFGSAGQANYAAANAFLDALAQQRQSQGLPAVALAWGPWDRSSGMAGGLTAADHERVRRAGLFPLSDGEGLALLDAATGLGVPSLIAAKLDRVRLRERAGDLAPVLIEPTVSTPNQVPSPPMDRTSALIRQLTGLDAAERESLLVEFVRAEASSVLRHSSPSAVGPNRPFTDLGLDSLASVEVRNRLGEVTGLRLPATLLFDFPTPAVLGSYLAAQIVVEEPAVDEAYLEEVDRLIASVVSASSDERARGALAGRLRNALAELEGQEDRANDLGDISGDELMSLIDAEFG